MESQGSRSPVGSGHWPNTAIVITIGLGLAVALIGAWGIYTGIGLARLQVKADGFETQLAQANDRIDALERDLADARSGSDPFAGGSALEDLLGGLLGGTGDAGGLGSLGDLLGGLLGGTGDAGGLGDLLGGGSEFGSCLVGTPGQYQISNASLSGQVEDITNAVEDLRGLSLPEGISPVFVTPDEMGDRVRRLAAESYPADVVAFDTRLWVALEMLDPGYDLLDSQLDLLDSGVAGYYDPDTHELVVATSASGDPLSAADQVTLAHEMIHAITDARLGFPASLSDPQADPERTRAIQALIEGDATLGMQQFSVGALDIGDQLGMLLDPRIQAATEDAAGYPYLLSSGLQLPYLEGMNFTCSLFSGGGWEAVDAAYDDPPESTAQILFPELYSAGTGPLKVPEPGQPGTGWSQLRVVGFGAADLLIIFSAPGDDISVALSDPRDRVRGWAGGTATVWTRGADTAVALSLIDNGDGSESLCDSLKAWADVAIGTNQVSIGCRADNVLVGIAPDTATAALLSG